MKHLEFSNVPKNVASYRYLLCNGMPLLPTKLRRALSSQGRLILKFAAIDIGSWYFTNAWIAAKPGLSDDASDFSGALTLAPSMDPFKVNAGDVCM